jgi:hypothetical protein
MTEPTDALPPATPEPSLAEIAYHEASHAVVCVALRHRFDAVCIVPIGDSLGRVTFLDRESPAFCRRLDRLDWGDKAAERWARKEIVVSLAGCIGQGMPTGALLEPSGPDWETAGTLALKLSGDEDDCTRILAQSAIRAQTILAEWWPAVEALAQALLQDRLILAKRARATVKEAMTKGKDR